MAEPESPPTTTPDAAPPAGAPRSKDEIALELMKFIATTTSYGKAAHTGAGFSAKPGGRSPEEHAEALLELYERCRRVVNG